MQTSDASVPVTATRTQDWESEQVRFEASGLTVREFCRQNNLGISTFYQRRALLRDLAGQLLGEHRTAVDEQVVSPIGAGFVDASVMELRQHKTEGSKTLCACSVKDRSASFVIKGWSTGEAAKSNPARSRCSGNLADFIWWAIDRMARLVSSASIRCSNSHLELSIRLDPPFSVSSSQAIAMPFKHSAL